MDPCSASSWRTVQKLRRWARGTNPSTLEKKRDQGRELEHATEINSAQSSTSRNDQLSEGCILRRTLRYVSIDNPLVQIHLIIEMI